MSTLSGPATQAQIEIRRHVFDYTLDLLTGVTVSSAAATLTEPDGTETALTVAVASPLVYVTVGPLDQIGQHTVDCNATCSNGEKLNVRLALNVDY